MTDAAQQRPVRVTAEERPHPAMQKLARAFIALARLEQRRDRNAADYTLADSDNEPADAEGGGGGDDRA